MADLLVPDVNNAHRVTDWAKVRALSPVLIAKMSEGTGYVAPTFAPHREGARSHRFIAFGAYHFWTPGADTTGQARNAVKALGALREDPAEFLILDVETGTDWAAYAAFCRYTDDALGRLTWLYAGRQAENAPLFLRQRPLWVARYFDHTPGPAGQPGIGEDLWQFTDRHRNAGVTGGTVDCSVHRGDVASLLDVIEGDDMPITDADVERVADRVTEKVAKDDTHAYTVAATRNAVTKRLDALAAKVDALSVGAVDPAVITDAVLAAFRKAGDAGA